MSNSTAFMVFLVLVAIVVGALIALGIKGWRDRRRDRRRRTRALLSTSEEMALRFSPKDEGVLPLTVRKLRGKRATITNVIHGQYGSLELYCFDDYWYNSSGDGGSSHWETVAALELDRHLPELYLASNDRFRRVVGSAIKFASIFNKKLRSRIHSLEMRFDDDPPFSEAYAVEAEDKASARECLSPAFRAHLVNLPDRWEIWMRNRWLILRTKTMVSQEPSRLDNDTRVAPERIRDFVETAYGIAKQIGQ